VRRPRPGGQAIAILAVAGLPCLGLIPGAGSAQASVGSHRIARAALVPSRAHGAPRISAPTIRHVPDAWEMQAVSCVSATHCVAVGYSSDTSTEGAHGVLVPITDGKPGKPLLLGGFESLFYGISCVSATDCVVAGAAQATVSSNLGADLWRWHSGKVVFINQLGSTPTLSTSRFYAIDCWSSTECLAVGYGNAKITDAPTGVYGSVSLKGTPSDHVVQNNTSGYASSITCPTSELCYIGGASVAGVGEELEVTQPDLVKHLTSGIEGSTQTGKVSGLQGIACMSVNSCEAAEVYDVPSMPGQFDGDLEHLNGKLSGTPHMIPDTSQFYAISPINHSYYLAVGELTGSSWITYLVSASGAASNHSTSEGGYLQGVSCPVQTECVAVGFAPDSNPTQPGGQGGVDGAIAVYHLTTPPSAPKVTVRSTTHHLAKVRITAPASDGGVAITSYLLAVSRCKPHHTKCTLEKVKTQPVKPSKLTVTVSGLMPHTTYYLSVTATNSIGTGPASSAKTAKTG